MIDAVPMPTALNVSPPLIAKVAEPVPALLIVKVPVERVELLGVVVVSCTCKTSVPLVLLVTLVAFHVPLAKMVAPAVEPPSSLSPDPPLKRVKDPLPVTVLLELTEPLPYNNSQSLPPDCRSTTTKLNVAPVVGGGVVEVTVRVTGNITEVGEVAEDVKVTAPLYVPATRPVVLIDIVSVAGVVPVAGLAMSQELAPGLALNACADPSLVVTITVCDGAVPPTVAVKVRPVELRLSVGMDGGPVLAAGMT